MLYIIIGIVIGIALTLLATALLRRTRLGLLLPDNGSKIFTTKNPEAETTMIRLLSGHGYRPVLNVDATGILRTFFSDGTLLNCILDGSLFPPCAIAIPVRNPIKAAAKDATLLRDQGFTATIQSNFDGDSPSGSLALIKTDVLANGGIVYRWPIWRLVWATRKNTSGKAQSYRPRAHAAR